jgi:UDP-2,4-diacetamido-2,4,6-trideoxy-beta-L-altropyranose hydrolase
MRASSRVAIRVDASAVIGTGHLRRCLTLAYELLEQGAQVCLVTRAVDDVAARLLRDVICHVHWLPAPSGDVPTDSKSPPHAPWAGVDWTQDASEAAEALRTERPDWLVVDHYAFDARWHEALRDRLSCRVLVIDDTADRLLAPDLLLDQNSAHNHLEKYAGRLTREPRWLTSPDYALISAAYRSAPRYAFQPEVRSVGIFMGGIDSEGIAARVLTACRDAGFAGTIEVVSTSANPHLSSLRETCSATPGTILTVDEPDLANFFARHDLQIGAGGGAAWERCCIGVPSLLLVTAANQRAVAPVLARLGAVAALDPDSAPTQANITEAVSKLLHDSTARRRIADVSRTLVDGLGARRVALVMLAESLSVRPATMNDAAVMLRWRNDPTTRAVSRDGAIISAQTHNAWLQRTLADADRCLLVGQVGNVEIGVIRFDGLGNEESEVSLYLDPALVGLGLGRWLLRAGEAHLQTLQPVTRTLVATVLDGNVGSQRMFAACGYSLHDARWYKPVGPTTVELTRR